MNQQINKSSLFTYEQRKIEDEKMKRLIKLVDSTSNGLKNEENLRRESIGRRKVKRIIKEK